MKLQNNFQTFNDGIVSIVREEKTANAGMRPKAEDIPCWSLRFEERKVGITRYYEALRADIKIAMVVRVPKLPITTQHIAVIGEQRYRISQVQKVTDASRPCIDLSLEVILP